MIPFPRYMRKLREERGLSTREAALKTKGRASHAYISQLESGQIACPAVDRLEALAEVYSVSPLELVARAYPSLFRRATLDDLRRCMMAVGLSAAKADEKIAEIRKELAANCQLQ